MGILDKLFDSNRDDDYDYNDDDYSYESDEFDEFDDDVIDEYDDEEETEMPSNVFEVHLPGSLQILKFIQSHFALQMEGETPMYIAKCSGSEITLLSQDDFEELISFESDEIVSYLNGNMGAAGFANINTDDMSDIVIQLLVVRAESEDNEDAEDADCKVHYQMRYLVDVENVDYRLKTIMDGKMTLNLVGIQYRDNYEDLLDNLEVGTPVILKHDPTNEYDANALAFYLSDGTMLGYLPKKDQPFARIFMKKGYIECEISNIDDTYIDTETTLSEDMVDYDEYNNGDVRISRTESRRGFGN
ncbi:MAG: HIRAN domain-containing protein, partial [Clostridia bacterium]|nr:HIRAN domain-containing protein [Clostridia bacterium]